MKYNYYVKNNIKNEIEFLKGNNRPISVRDNENFEMCEIDAIIALGNMIGNVDIANEFLKLKEIPQDVNVEQFLVQNRNKVMKKVVNQYTKHCISLNLLKPDESTNIDKEGLSKVKSIDLVFNAVNNYYDSLYARYTNFDEQKVLPEYDEKNYKKLKYNSYKKIMNGVGVLGIRNAYIKSKLKSFPQFCLETTLLYVRNFNDTADKLLQDGIHQGEIEIVNQIDDSNVSELNPGDIDLDLLKIDKATKSNVEFKIPLMYSILENSYNSRSTVERFFSYFPFIFPKAKEERRVMSTMRNALERDCYIQMDSEDFEINLSKAVNESKKEYFKEEIEKLNYVEEEAHKEIVEGLENDVIEEDSVEVEEMINRVRVNNLFRY